MIARELLTRLGFQVDETGARQYERRLGEVRGQAQNLSRLLFRGLALFGAGSLFNQFTQIADKMTDYESRVRLAIGANGDLEKTMNDLKNLAQNTYSSFDQTTESFLRNNEVLKELGHTYDESLAYTASLNDALVISGTKGDDAAAVMNNLNRAMQMGHLKGDQFNAVMSRGGRIAELLRRKYGKTTDQLREMAADGLLPMPEFFELMTEAGEENRKMAADMPQTYADARQNMRTELDAMVNQINKVAGTTAFLAEMVDQVRFAMVAWTPKIIDAVQWVDQLGTALGSWEEVFKTIGFGLAAFASSQVIANIGYLAAAFYRLAWPLLFIIGLGFAIEDFVGWMQGKKSNFGELFGDVEEHAAAVEKLNKAWNFIKSLTRNVKVLYTVLALVVGLRLATWAISLAKGLKTLWVAFGMVTSVIRIVNGALWLLAANPVVLTIMAIVLAIAALVAIGYDFYKWVNGGDSYLGKLFGPWSEVVRKLKRAWQGLTEWLERIWNNFVGLFTNLLQGDFKGAWENILGILEDLWAALWELSIFGLIERMAPGFFDPVRSAFKTAIAFLTGLWNSFVKWWSDTMPSAPQWFKDFMNFSARGGLVNRGGGAGTGGGAGGGSMDTEGFGLPMNYVPQARGGGGTKTTQVNVNMPGMAFNVTVPAGTTEEQARAIYASLETQFDTAFNNHIYRALHDLPDAEEAVA